MVNLTVAHPEQWRAHRRLHPLSGFIDGLVGGPLRGLVYGLVRAMAYMALALGICLPLATAADELSPPTGDVLLIIDGDIAHTNVGDEAHLDLAMLQALPPLEFSTHTPWEDGLNHFAGARLSDVLSAVGASSSDFLAVGTDDYQVEFAGVDLERYPVLLAWEHNGEPISLRKLGPLRILFPFDDYPELDTNINRAMAVWQLIKMSVR